MIFRKIPIYFLFFACCESYQSAHQQVSLSGGVKSYGGYFTDESGQNQAATQFVNSQNYQQPLTSYQPYGWNLNQPTRTYGGVNVMQSRYDPTSTQPNYNQGNIGWADNRFNNMNNMGVNPMYNSFPFFPMPQIPFPQFPFPNFNFYPNMQPNYQSENLPYPTINNMPQPPTSPPMTTYISPENTQQNVLAQRPDSTQSTTINHRVDQNKLANGTEFSTNNFFENTDDRQWSIDQEREWQATTKKPFFENTVPGLGCTLPAASIIGAKDVFSAVELLPLSIPVGKPILSCNATGLKQTYVKIKNRVYSCKDGVINIECRGANNVNNCPGLMLMCDLRSSKPISCTNGTLVSTRDIECATIQIGNPQSVLNCAFKDEDIDVRFQTASSTSRVTTDETTTRAPIKMPTRKISTTSQRPSNVDYDDQQTLETINRVEFENTLVPQVKQAIQNVFPAELFMKPSTKLLPPKSYLPPFESQASRDLVTSMRGIFPLELLVVSKSKANNNNGDSTTSSYDIRLSENTNIKQKNNDDSVVGFKTQLSGIDTRFSENMSASTQKPLHQQQDFRDRLIFSN